MRQFFLLVPFSLFLLFSGCGDSDSVTKPRPPAITAQAVTKTVAAGDTPTFTVSPTGTGPFTYQWFWNGVRVDGNGASYTAPPIASSDDQSTISVTVTNDLGSASAAVATLSVPGSPRHPEINDLRFKDLDTVPMLAAGGASTNVMRGSSSYENSFGFPLVVGDPGPQVPTNNPDLASWFYIVESMPNGAVGRTNTYQVGILTDLAADLDVFFDSQTVITSLDVSSGQNAYAVRAVKTAGADRYPSYVSGTASADGLQAVATAEAQAGRVVTAVALSGGIAYYLAYGREGDLRIYESKVVTATVDSVSNAAADLAAQGWIITAVGGNIREGFLLVGTRVSGDATPRPFQVKNTPALERGYTPVGTIYTGAVLPTYFFEQ
ncbi:immunoglobulin domain-containing family protein [Geomesophilobacter sediminis]|uniref:Ig-like domain-containing protein n=1 Tax=Geomesophilobacter sediminis TaxID=2798584 RepID=A0A8J7IL65_9BACT|nr:hypothetical protein [Geomesophilobacter sediminis]MBJ6723438.1 hypothetical protein [Geomesophilobacter sediminis]